ncbi:MAG: ABC transporter ATP-binding protein [Anaerolineales bacterium]|nr:ABC transporter ATP-binding protein [Anaerolineales bacterium]
MSNTIVVKEASKEYQHYHTHRPTTLQEAILQGLRKIKPINKFKALDQVSFTIKSGQMVGVIGANGAGKSTLLRLIGGVGRPDKGKVEINGRIGALLDLGAGFHSDLTGRENTYINGVISGLTRQEVTDRFDSIVAFAELENFIDNPLRTYSTGMRMRLAFAIAVHIDPDILLIDEVLAVGDMAFQEKCLKRIAQFKERGCTILLVSHDIEQVRHLCDEVIWLQSGRIKAQGPSEVVVQQYIDEMSSETQQRTPVDLPVAVTAAGTELRVNENRFGSMEVEIISVRLLDALNRPITQMTSGEPLRIEIIYQAPTPIESPIFGVLISRDDGLVCYDTNTATADLIINTVQGQGQITLYLERLDLNNGHYWVDIGIYEKNWAYAYDYHWHVYPLPIHSPSKKGVLCPPSQWEVKHSPESQKSLLVSIDTY